MSVIQWRADFETGVSSMDAQHEALIKLINQLFEIVRDKREDGSLNDVMAELTRYTEEHLNAEEALLKEHDYPDMDEQKDNHAEFIAKMEQLNQQISQQQHAVAPEVYKYLRQWWVGHIMGIDKKYGPFLNEKGVK